MLDLHLLSEACRLKLRCVMTCQDSVWLAAVSDDSSCAQAIDTHLARQQDCPCVCMTPACLVPSASACITHRGC